MQTYTEYRNTTIPWVGRIPSSWTIVPLRSVFSESKVKNENLVENNLLSLSYGRIIRKDIDTVGGLLPESFETYQIVEPDHLVFRFTDLQNDQRSLRTARVVERGIITSAYVSARPFKIDARYGEYLMRSYDLTKVFYGLGGGVRQSLKFADIARLPILLPSATEQRAIADYLDRETARIDTLVSEQEHLVRLQRERRQAVIDGAFVNADTNSRIVRACLDVVDCPHTTPAVDDDEQFEAVRTASVRRGRYRPGHGLRVSHATWRERNAGGAPSLGDIIFAREGGSAGEAAMVPSEAICLGQRMVLLRIDASVCVGEFLLWQLYSRRVQDHFRLSMSGAAAGNIRVATLRSTAVWLPPLETQRLIAAHLNDQTAKIDSMIAETERFIELVLERRAALITAAVTGQIDIREMV